MKHFNTPYRISDKFRTRWWKPSCILAWGIFLAFEIYIGLDRIYSKNPLCPHSDLKYGKWYWYTIVVVFGGFLTTWGELLTKIVQSNPGNERVPYLTAFNIVTMGTLATLLSLVFDWGGVCIDVLGYDYYVSLLLFLLP